MWNGGLTFEHLFLAKVVFTGALESAAVDEVEYDTCGMLA